MAKNRRVISPRMATKAAASTADGEKHPPHSLILAGLLVGVLGGLLVIYKDWVSIFSSEVILSQEYWFVTADIPTNPGDESGDPIVRMPSKVPNSKLLLPNEYFNYRDGISVDIFCKNLSFATFTDLSYDLVDPSEKSIEKVSSNCLQITDLSKDAALYVVRNVSGKVLSNVTFHLGYFRPRHTFLGMDDLIGANFDRDKNCLANEFEVFVPNEEALAPIENDDLGVNAVRVQHVFDVRLTLQDGPGALPRLTGHSIRIRKCVADLVDRDTAEFGGALMVGESIIVPTAIISSYTINDADALGFSFIGSKGIYEDFIFPISVDVDGESIIEAARAMRKSFFITFETITGRG